MLNCIACIEAFRISSWTSSFRPGTFTWILFSVGLMNETKTSWFFTVVTVLRHLTEFAIFLFMFRIVSFSALRSALISTRVSARDSKMIHQESLPYLCGNSRWFHGRPWPKTPSLGIGDGEWNIWNSVGMVLFLNYTSSCTRPIADTSWLLIPLNWYMVYSYTMVWSLRADILFKLSSLPVSRSSLDVPLIVWLILKIRWFRSNSGLSDSLSEF